MNTIDRVKEFHLAFGHPVASFPTAGTEKDRVLRVKLIAEELLELCNALGVSLWLETEDRPGGFHLCHVESLPNKEVDLVEAADALGDLDYVVAGANLVFGLPAVAVAEEIHVSNMSKLGADGKPVYREDGKILKGPNYFKPNIVKIIHGVDHGGD